MLKQHAQNLRENSYWMNIIKSDVLGYGDNNTDYENIVNGITLDDMKKFTKKLFNGKNIIEVTMTRSCRRRNEIKTRMSKLK